MASPAATFQPPKATAASGEPADVCLLLEGTWPYVRGGVSTWVHQILTALPDLRFAVVFIGAEKAAAGQWKYEPPSNLVNFTELFLFDPAFQPRPKSGRANRQT
ncbi:MAG: DUF3492 domain-containing protein, partial [Verrucomicrobiae bacterium]|nr:DUF3492 domain-containing protein [Verrucomicrobiae bacterium]